MNSSAINTPRKTERTAQLVWTAFILLFFVLQAILWTVAISATAQDPSHAVVSGYDEQALDWDEVKQRQIASKALGWNAEIAFAGQADNRGVRSVELKLVDQDGSPIQNARIDVKVFHRGHAADAKSVDFVATEQGTYVGKTTVRHDGWWVFEGTAKLNDDVYLINRKVQINR